jgi:hypothetical protein
MRGAVSLCAKGRFRHLAQALQFLADTGLSVCTRPIGTTAAAMASVPAAGDDIVPHAEKAWEHWRQLGSPRYHVAPMVDQVRPFDACIRGKLSGNSAHSNELPRDIAAGFVLQNGRVSDIAHNVTALRFWLRLSRCAQFRACRALQRNGDGASQSLETHDVVMRPMHMRMDTATTSTVCLRSMGRYSYSAAGHMCLQGCPVQQNAMLLKLNAVSHLQSELPFRMLCRKYGATAAYTPMLHARLFGESAQYRCAGLLRSQWTLSRLLFLDRAEH